MKCLMILFIILGVLKSQAKVDVKATKRIIIPVDNVTPKLTSEDVQKVLPPDVAQTSNSSNIWTRIADRGFSLWFNSAAVKESTLGRVAQQTQEKLKTDVVLEEGQGPEKISHKFSFRVEAFQALAKLEYTGWLRAAINYDAKAACTDFEVREKIFADKNLVVSHKSSSDEDLSMVGVNWSF